MVQKMPYNTQSFYPHMYEHRTLLNSIYIKSHHLVRAGALDLASMF